VVYQESKHQVFTPIGKTCKTGDLFANIPLHINTFLIMNTNTKTL